MEFRFANCVLDDARMSLTRDDIAVAVEPRVFDLIHLLVRKPGELVTRDQMIDEVWEGRIVSDSAISACIASARKAVGDDGKAQSVIQTVARRGLKLVARVSTPLSDAPRPMHTKATSARVRYIKGRDGRSISVAVGGDGPPLLRVDPPGWDIETEMSSRGWGAATEALERHYRTARFTRREFDQDNNGAPKIDFDEMAGDIGAVADAAGFERFTLVAQSGGSHGALRFAVRHPDRVARLVILGGYVEGRSTRSGTELESDSLRRLISESWRAEVDGIGAAFMMAYFPEGPLDVIVDGGRIFQNFMTKETELAIRDALNSVDNRVLLPLVKCPTLIVHARNDAVHPVSEGRKLAAGIPKSELLVLETANHIPLPGSPVWDTYWTALQEFLNENH